MTEGFHKGDTDFGVEHAILIYGVVKGVQALLDSLEGMEKVGETMGER